MSKEIAKQLEELWSTWTNGQVGVDFPETYNPWEEQAKLEAQLCPECGQPRGGVIEPRCPTCIGDNFMEPL